jgi:hypothetical protein
MEFKSPVALAAAALSVAALGSGCTVYQAPPPPQHEFVQPIPAVTYVEPAPQAVVSIYVEPPILQPAPILVGWAPPPMLVEMPPPLPYAGAVWVGGYWVWEGNWVWAAGHWMAPPQPNYAWVHPYYEHRDSGVVFITGHWSPPGVVFVPPAISLRLTLVKPLPGVVPGLPPIGPQGVFVPPPPGSRFGLIVPAPIGTPPAVVTSAAPVVNVGMRIQNNSNTTINNTHVTNVTNITNVTNVTIVAPASATASGKAFESAVPAQAHLAAALPPVVHAQAPMPASTKAVPAFTPGRAPVVLPPAQMVHSTAAPTPNAPPQRVAPTAGATTTAIAIAPPPPAAPAVAAPLPVLPKPPAAPERPVPASVPQRQIAETPRPPAPAASAVRLATATQRPVAPSKDDAQVRAEQERKVKAETVAHNAPGAPHPKKKEDEEKPDKGEKRAP